jgi:hypothetical protein
MKKTPIEIRNVALDSINVALNPSVERSCILLQEKRAIFPKPQKSSLKIRDVDLNNINVASDVGLNIAVERPCIHLEKQGHFPKIGNIIFQHKLCSR